MTEDTLVLVGCGQNKRDSKQPIWKLYEGDYFDKKMTLAMLLGHPAVLSAKHGLVMPHEKIEPYDEDLREKEDYKKESWALSVFNSIPEDYEKVAILAGKDYREHLIPMLESANFEVDSPFDSNEMSGIGDQIEWLGKCIEEEIEKRKAY